MRMIITEADIPSIVGRFIVEVNNTSFNPDIKTDFYFEKRIRFISQIEIESETRILVCGFYYTNKLLSRDEFVSYFNDHNQRYHRLLTTVELDWLNEYMKKMNY